MPKDAMPREIVILSGARTAIGTFGVRTPSCVHTNAGGSISIDGPPAGRFEADGGPNHATRSRRGSREN